MDTTTGYSRERLAQLRQSLATLRDEFAYVENEYKAGRLSSAEEVALIGDISHDAHAVIAEALTLTRPPAFSRKGV